MLRSSPASFVAMESVMPKSEPWEAMMTLSSEWESSSKGASVLWLSHHDEVMVVLHRFNTPFAEVEVRAFCALVSCSQNRAGTAAITCDSVMDTNLGIGLHLGFFLLLESVFDLVDDAWHHLLNLLGDSPVELSFHMFEARETSEFRVSEWSSDFGLMSSKEPM